MITSLSLFWRRTLRSHFRRHLSVSLFLLLVLPGTARWHRKNHFDSTGLGYSPNSTSGSPWTRSTYNGPFISREALKEFNVQVNNSWERLGGVDHTHANDDQFPNDVDVIFRIHRGIHSNKSVLNIGILDGFRVDRNLKTIRKISINQPFVESIPSSASSIRKFVDSVANGTLQPDDRYKWDGGYISDFNLTRSRVKRIHAECNELQITYYDKETFEPLRTENITWVIHRPDTDWYSYYVYIYPAERGSPLCGDVDTGGGDGLFLKEHGALSQRLRRIVSNHLPLTPQGKIFPEDLNSGNVAPKLHYVNSTLRTTGYISIYYFDIQSAVSNYYGDQRKGQLRTLWLQAEDAFEQQLAAYNNVGFLLLSITALVSSTIIAIVTSRKASRGEYAVVVVEGLVVVLFLYVLSHALVVYSRENDFVVDYGIEQNTVGYYEDDEDYDIEVRGYFQVREAIVGKRLNVPGLLVAAEVCAIIACLVVFGNIIRLLWNSNKVKAVPILVAQGDTEDDTATAPMYS